MIWYPPRSFSTELIWILLSHILISWSQFAMVCCLCLYEIYISLVLETFNDMLFELHQEKTFCKSVVKVSTNVSIELLDVPIVVSSANMSAQVLVSERGRLFTQTRKSISIAWFQQTYTIKKNLDTYIVTIWFKNCSSFRMPKLGTTNMTERHFPQNSLLNWPSAT